jgi:short-subunit dehydrogenase
MTETQNLKSTQKIAWITGASTGIGRAVAIELAGAGWHVAASARDQEKLVALAHESLQLAGRIYAYPLDVTDERAVINVADKIYHELGFMDLVILNAGSYTPDHVTEFSTANIHKTYGVNFYGVLHGLSAVLPRMFGKRRGHVAVVASVAGYRGLPTSIAYGSSKAALIHLAEALKFDCDPAGIKVQVINPGFVRTPLTNKNRFPMPFLLEVDDAARRIVRGLARDQFEITFPWRFVFWLKILRILPYRWYFSLVKWGTRHVDKN